jgi:hypothetical protein
VLAVGVAGEIDDTRTARRQSAQQPVTVDHDRIVGRQRLGAGGQNLAAASIRCGRSLHERASFDRVDN